METGTLFSLTIQKAIVVLLILIPQTSYAKSKLNCSPSSCGNIPNISYPFRLRTDPENCGDLRYNLSCENNNTVLYLYSGKYYVQSINYHNHTIRVVDSNVQKGSWSSLPLNSLADYNFTRHYHDPYSSKVRTKLGMRWYRYQYSSLSELITFLSCENPVNSPLYIPTPPPCINNHGRCHSYAKTGTTYISELEDSCRIDLMVMTSWRGIRQNSNFSYSELEYGFELLWLQQLCYVDYFDRFFLEKNDSNNVINCAGLKSCDYMGLLPASSSCGILTKIGALAQVSLDVVIFYFVPAWTIAKFLLGTPCVIAFFIYKWKKRHLSMYDVIEEFLQTNNNLMPIRYSYSDIRKMTKGFKDKLGEGGYGSVYKGKLRSNRLVAIKMLSKSKANGQDFINEVATIGRIHHVNVVQLVGFCAEGSKRALVYDFMSNGSLDKYIFSPEKNSLACKKLYEISIGVASGIEYLHQGCNMQILHFDIKPHNILLDENFTPKVSDFGLARLYPLDNRTVSLTAARGTIGYIAPELFYKNIGRISYKADVYSFGMLLMEMASGRKNLNAVAEHTSQIYFPSWVYDQINEEKDLEMEDETDDELNIRKKMIMVALWCIQMKPIDRPSMNKVREMLEGELDSLQMPQRPFLCSEKKPADEHVKKSNSKCTPTSSDDNSEEISLNLHEN